MNQHHPYGDLHGPLDNRRFGEWAGRIAWFTFGVLVASGYVMICKPNAQKLAEAASVLEDFKRLNTELAMCLPVDLGQISVMTLQMHGSVMKLQCDKHAKRIVEVPVSTD